MNAKFVSIVGILIAVLVLVLPNRSTIQACGGLFCQDSPVDQQAEQIIFTINPDDTISAYVQINYTGSAEEFSWVVPVPSIPEIDVAEADSFSQLRLLTDPFYIPPPIPDCAPWPEFSVLLEVIDSDTPTEEQAVVTVLSAGTAGPFAFEVVTSESPDALVMWLRENSYRVTEAMEPLIDVYTQEGMVFLAMKLQPDQGVQDIQPIKMTYEGQSPTIPLRLTAVAANPNMSVLTWIFADEPAYPTNYAHPIIKDEDIRFFYFQSNYLQLVDRTVDLYEGRAFVTEYAQPTTVFAELEELTDPFLIELAGDHQYMTRFFGRISPEEMTVDPSFALDSTLPTISNIHDLRELDAEKVWDCEELPVEVEYDPSSVPDNWQ